MISLFDAIPGIGVVLSSLLQVEIAFKRSLLGWSEGQTRGPCHADKRQKSMSNSRPYIDQYRVWLRAAPSTSLLKWLVTLRDVCDGLCRKKKNMKKSVGCYMGLRVECSRHGEGELRWLLLRHEAGLPQEKIPLGADVIAQVTGNENFPEMSMQIMVLQGSVS